MPHEKLQICVRLTSLCSNSAVNMTLPVFAAEPHAVAPLLLGTGICHCRSVCPLRVLSSKRAAHCSNCQMMGQMDALPLHSPWSAYSVGNVNNVRVSVTECCDELHLIFCARTPTVLQTFK